MSTAAAVVLGIAIPILSNLLSDKPAKQLAIMGLLVVIAYATILIGVSSS